MHLKCIKNALNRLHDASKRLPRRLQDAPRRILPPFWAPTWGHLGHLFPPKTASRPPGRLQKAFLGMSWDVLGACWGLLAAKSQQERLLEPSWPDFHPFLGGFWLEFWFIFLADFLAEIARRPASSNLLSKQVIIQGPLPLENDFGTASMIFLVKGFCICENPGPWQPHSAHLFDLFFLPWEY